LRLAEFKTRLFIFVARRLLHWAGSIERETVRGQSPPALPMAGDESPSLAASAGSEHDQVSGPPEHWVRLVATAPPQHWLDLLGDGQNDVPLPADASEPAAAGPLTATKEQRTTGTRAEPNPLADERRVVSSSPPAGETKSANQTNLRDQGARGNSWLNRLQFYPPAPRAQLNETVGDVPHTVGDEPSPPPVTRHSAATGSDNLAPPSASISRRPTDLSETRYDVAGSPVALDGEAFESRASHAEAVRPKDEVDLKPGERRSRPQVFMPPAPIRSRNAESNFQQHSPDQPSEFSEGELSFAADPTKPPDTRRAVVRGNTFATRTAAAKQTHSGETGRGRELNFAERSARNTSGFTLHEVAERARFKPAGGAERATETELAPTGRPKRPDLPAWNPEPPTRREPTPLFSAGPQPKLAGSTPTWRNEFASVTLEANSLIGSRGDQGESLWPTLPVARGFELADELANAERDDDSLQRLEREQRGNLWNE
jgi:hypothetical protein